MKEQSMYEETTIAAIATAPGEGGIGIIRLSGVSASEIADKIFHTGKIKTFKEAVPRMMYFGHVTDGEKRIDEGLAVYMKAPHSYTGEDVVEIQIHGSAEALRETLALALRSGAVPAMRGEFTKRAFLNGRLDLAQAEAVMDIISAKGEAALTQAESHLSGALSGFVHEVMEKLKDLITKLEVTIDYPEEDLEDLTMEETGDALEKIDKSLSALLKRSEEGRVIREGLRTAIIGRPNAGKSSLLNALLQEERAIVTDVPAQRGTPLKRRFTYREFPSFLWIPPVCGKRTIKWNRSGSNGRGHPWKKQISFLQSLTVRRLWMRKIKPFSTVSAEKRRLSF